MLDDNGHKKTVRRLKVSEEMAEPKNEPVLRYEFEFQKHGGIEELFCGLIENMKDSDKKLDQDTADKAREIFAKMAKDGLWVMVSPRDSTFSICRRKEKYGGVECKVLAETSIVTIAIDILDKVRKKQNQPLFGEIIPGLRVENYD